MTGKPIQWCRANSISIALAGVVAANAAGAAWWSASMAAQVGTNETNVATNTRHVEGLRAGQRGIAETLASLGAKMDSLMVQTAMMARRLDAGASGYGGGR